jgi:hypothetical protein
MVTVVFQNNFRLEMHENIFFIFYINISKQFKKTQEKQFEAKKKNKKNSIFFKNAFETQKQALSAKKLIVQHLTMEIDHFISHQ